MDLYLQVMKTKYAEFNGRARRSEYWWFTLVNVVVLLVLDGIGYALIFTHTIGLVGFLFVALGLLWSLANLVPGIGVSVRRLHDTGKSGWLLLIMLVPFVNFIMDIVLLVFFCMDSTPGANQYGENPKGVAAAPAA